MTDSSLDGLNLGNLRTFFAQHVAGATGGELSAELISGGRSNLTFGIQDGETDYVLRRPPLGHVLATAHDMAREFKVITALQGSAVPVPKALAFCDDLDVNGAPFYVMERVEGRILRGGGDLAKLGRDDALKVSEVLVDVLAALHRVDYNEVGLSEFGRPDGFLERQVRRWGKQWDSSKAAGCPDNPEINEIARRLTAYIPPSPNPTIVHGDYRLDNTMLDSVDAGKVVAVLDWEMSTLGDPLADLGLFLLYETRSDAQVVATGSATPTDIGTLDRDAIVKRYAKGSNIDVTYLDWYEVFASFKLAIIVAGIHARYLMGLTRGDGFDHMGALVGGLAHGAIDFANRSELPSLRG